MHIFRYDTDFLSERGWWSKQKNRPAFGLVVGDNANTQLDWFKCINSEYQLTNKGVVAYISLLENNNRLENAHVREVCRVIKMHIENGNGEYG